jgi:hypothetical protein
MEDHVCGELPGMVRSEIDDRVDQRVIYQAAIRREW